MPNNEKPFSMEDIMKIAASPAGQQLIRMLQQSGGAELQQAAQKAAVGDYDSARQALSNVMQDPQVKKLLEELGR